MEQKRHIFQLQAQCWPRCGALIIEKIEKMWYIFIIEYCYSVFKRKEILPYATTWLNLEDIMLSEKGSHQTTICIVTSQVNYLEGKTCRVPYTTAKSCESQAIIKGRVIYSANPHYNRVDYADKFIVCLHEFIVSYEVSGLVLDFPGFL